MIYSVQFKIVYDLSIFNLYNEFKICQIPAALLILLHVHVHLHELFQSTVKYGSTVLKFG